MSGERPDCAAADPAELEVALDYRFADRAQLETALTHSSYANENALHADNERLEFLGDSVIGMVAAQLLYRAHPEWREGELTRALHQLVDRRGLASLAGGLDLGAYLRLGRTELLSGGRSKETILANAMEAVLGAMYLDRGLEPVEAFARRVFAQALAVEAPRVELDPKTRFQEWVMQRFGFFPTYRIVADTQIEGDAERFSSEVMIGEQGIAVGIGRSKRDAERGAAAGAYAIREEIEEESERVEESADA